MKSLIRLAAVSYHLIHLYILLKLRTQWKHQIVLQQR